MQIYNALIIGCGYASLGYAAAIGNAVICEEQQICDTGFYFPLRSFKHIPYTTKTEEGAALEAVFDELSLFSSHEQNTNGFECAICKYILKTSTEVLLKSRVVDVKRQSDGIFDVTLSTNEGLIHRFAKEVLRAENISEKKRVTVLFTTKNIERDRALLLSTFRGADIEGAFYKDRFAIHINSQGLDENTVKVWIYNKWKSIATEAKIICIAPIIYGDGVANNPLCDLNYDNPLKAFEAGFFYAKEKTNDFFLS